MLLGIWYFFDVLEMRGVFFVYKKLYKEIIIFEFIIFFRKENVVMIKKVVILEKYSYRILEEVV